MVSCFIDGATDETTPDPQIAPALIENMSNVQMGLGCMGCMVHFSLEVLIVLRLYWKAQSEIHLKTPRMMESRVSQSSPGRGGYGVGVNVMVLVNGQWLPGKARARCENGARIVDLHTLQPCLGRCWKVPFTASNWE